MLQEVLPLTLCRFRYSSRNIVRNASHVSKSSTKAIGNCHEQRKKVQHLHCRVAVCSNFSLSHYIFSFQVLRIFFTISGASFFATFSEAARSPTRRCSHEFAFDGDVLGSAQLIGLRHRRRYHRVCSILPIQLRCV